MNHQARNVIQLPTTPPPSDLHAEAAVLAAIMEHADAFDIVTGIIGAKDFYSNTHRILFNGFAALRELGRPFDAITVLAWLKDQDVLGEFGGMKEAIAYLERLTVWPSEVFVVESHATIVRDKARMRHIAETCTKIAATARTYGGSVQGFLDRAEQALHEVAAAPEMETLVHVGKPLVEKFERWKDAGRARTANGLKTGFGQLDGLLGGLRQKTLTILAARPGCGKTSFATNFATTVAMRGGGPVVFFSLEMSADELTDRQLASESGVPLCRIRNPVHLADIEDVLVRGAGEAIRKVPFWIDDRAGLGTLEIRAKCNRVKVEAKKRFGIDGLALVVVDYLGLMAEPERARSREQAVAHNTRELKKMAKELEVPVLVLCQMNREIEKRQGPPRLSDLRESGAIEQDSDNVWFLHQRDHKSDEERREEEPVELIVAKNRNGITGAVALLWRGSVTRFETAPPKPPKQ